MKEQETDSSRSTGSKTTFDRAVDSILDYIRQNNLTSGATLPPAEVFCKQYGFSRVIFREAISYLKGLGVISSGRGKGIQLNLLDPLQGVAKLLPIFFSVSRNYTDLHQLRCHLELGALPIIFKNITPEDLDNLEGMLKQGDELLSRPVVRNYEFNTIDRHFHQYLCKLSGNRLLIEVSTYYRHLFGSFNDEGDVSRPIDLEDFKISQEGHRALLSCLRYGCLEAAMQVMFKHLHQRYDLPKRSAQEL